MRIEITQKMVTERNAAKKWVLRGDIIPIKKTGDKMNMIRKVAQILLKTDKVALLTNMNHFSHAGDDNQW